MTRKRPIETRAVHGGATPDPVAGAVMQPIYQTSTYAQSAPGEYKLYDYSRAGNPSRTAVETALAEVEGAGHAFTFASGLAATQAVVQLLDPPARVLVCDDVYGGTGRLFRTMFAKYGLGFDLIDMTDLANVEAAWDDDVRLVWLESPTNPLLKVIDIAGVADIAAGTGALVAVDNTVATPVFQNPIDLGADLVVHSTTKYLGGHSDLIGGAVVTSDDDLAERIGYVQFAGGSVPSPFESFLLHRSIKTLAVRMAQHERNALAVAEFLEAHPRVLEVHYPGLASSLHHELARKQMRGFSAMMSFTLDGGYDDVVAMLGRLELIVLAESLGGVESLINHPERMTHASVPPELRAQLGIGPNLLRLSVGIEHPDDLIEDLDRALG